MVGDTLTLLMSPLIAEVFIILLLILFTDWGGGELMRGEWGYGGDWRW